MRCYVCKFSVVVAIESLRGARNFKQVKITVAVIVKKHYGAAELFEQWVSEWPHAARGQNALRNIRENYIGSTFVDKFWLGSGGSDGFSVATLLEIVLPEGGGAAAFA